MTYKLVKEGAFRQLVQNKAIQSVRAVESKIVPDKFNLVGVSCESPAVEYVVRHGRTPDLRVWRLDNLIAHLKAMGFKEIHVSLRQTNNTSLGDDNELHQR